VISIKDTDLYHDVLQELNYDFADVYVFENFVVSEIKEDVIFNYDNHAKQMV